MNIHEKRAIFCHLCCKQLAREGFIKEQEVLSISEYKDFSVSELATQYKENLMIFPRKEYKTLYVVLN